MDLHMGRALLLFALALLCAVPLGAQTGRVRWRHLTSKNGQLPVPNGGTQQTACVVFDVDGDGVNDIVLSERTQAPSVVWLRRTKDGWEKYVIDDQRGTPEAGGAFADIDGDGDLDLVLGGDYQSNEVWWYENPAPHFDPNVPWKKHLIKKGGATQHHDKAFGDFEGLGKPQLAFWNQGARTLFLAEIPPNPRAATSWPARAIWTAPDGAPNQEGMSVYDVDGDAKPDLLAGNHWFKYAGGGKFTAVQVSPNAGRILAGRFKPGKYPQIVIAPGDGTGPLMYYECSGDPMDPKAWVGRNLLGRDVIHGHSLGIADVDGDGHLDIFCAEMAKWTESRPDPDNPNATAWILYGDGKGGFEVTEFARGVGFHESRLADLNGDGRPDVVDKPYNWETPRIDVWLNEGR
jgi:hypothetical protein